MIALLCRRLAFTFPKKTLSLQNKLEPYKTYYEQLYNRFMKEGVTELPNADKLKQLQKELEEISVYKGYYETHQSAINAVIENQKLLNDKDKDIRLLAKEEENTLNASLQTAENNIIHDLIQEEITDSSECTLEIIQAMGGAESALFAEDILNMYEHFAQLNNWNWNMTKKTTDAMIGKGIKNAFIEISGNSCFGSLKFENGVHKYMHN